MSKFNYNLYVVFGTLFGSITVISGWDDIIKMRITSILFLTFVILLFIVASKLKNKHDASLGEQLK